MIADRLKALKKQMAEEKLDALVVLTSDEHLNEYVPPQNRRLEAITGFTGSAGTAIIMLEEDSALFIDSRYHLQAKEESGEYFKIKKLGMEGVPQPEKWMALWNKQPLRVGTFPYSMSPTLWKRYQKAWTDAGHTLAATEGHLIDRIWEQRPVHIHQPIFPLDEEHTGEPVKSKLENVRAQFKLNHADALILTLLDEIAWLTNLRGGDIEHNPVFEAYAVVMKDRALCFCHQQEASLSDIRPEWEFLPYDEFSDFLKKLTNDQSLRVWIDPSGTTMGTWNLFKGENLLEAQSPVVLLKACKNPVEIACAKNAHLHAASGLVRSFAILDQRLSNSMPTSEAWFSDLLYQEYSREEGFFDLSFKTIAGAGANGAIVHYGIPSEEKALLAEEMLLVDSGIQCAGGTTDCTRTLSLGKPDFRQKEIYTRVLQAHIRLALQIFPEGASGTALDAITRAGLWNEGLDYGHGTGHGVGAFLNVHEGPQRISPLAYDVDLRPGMIVSNEPGYYESGWGGVRLENLYYVKRVEKEMPDHPGGKRWLWFKPLTWVPFDQKLINRTLMDPRELSWLDDYHRQTLEMIEPLLDKESHREWLRGACRIQD